jgi:hypothetical protein
VLTLAGTARCGSTDMNMNKAKPPSVTVQAWLRANLGPRCLAPLTSVDARALAAAVQIVELYAYDRAPEVLEAFGQVVARMQPHTQQLAYHAIAHVMDWNDRRTIWDLAGLPLPHLPLARCAFEPGGPVEGMACADSKEAA